MRKFFFTVMFLTGTVMGFDGPPPVSGADDETGSFHLGLESLVGFRSHYVFRGTELGKGVSEVQIASVVSLSNNLELSYDGGYLYGFDAKNFGQAHAGLELAYYVTNKVTLGGLAGANWYNRTPFNNGMELGLAWHWTLNKDWEIKSYGLYDFGQSGWYGSMEVTWQPLITERCAWMTTVALSVVRDYQGKDGFNDVMLRTGPLIPINKVVEVQPYVSFYRGMGDNDGLNTFNIGVWLTLKI